MVNKICRVMCYLSGVCMVLNRSVHAQLLDLNKDAMHTVKGLVEKIIYNC